MARVALELGWDLDPWQRYVLDVGLELRPSGLPAYREVRVSVGRQQGKSTLVLPASTHRALVSERLGWGAKPRVKLTAQNAQMARRKLLEDYQPVLEASPKVWRHVKRVVQSAGREGVVFDNGARVEVGGNSRDSNHGQVISGGFLDECFAYTDDATEQSVRPGMLTIPSAQLWLLSAAGDAQSIYWNDKVQDGRDRVESGLESSVAYFEWSMSDEQDIYDEQAWPTFMPMVASGRVSLDVIRDELDGMPRAVAERAFGNRWVEAVERLIPPLAWAACRDPEASPAGTLHLALDVSPGGAEGGRSAALVVAGRQAGIPVLEVIDHREGTGWVPERLAELDRRHGFASVSMDSVGPVRLLIDDVKRVIGPKRTKVLGMSDVVGAAGKLHEAILEGTVRHRGQATLDAAVTGAAKRYVGDAWAFGRRTSTADICPLIGSSLAHWAVTKYADAPLKIHGGSRS